MRLFKVAFRVAHCLILAGTALLAPREVRAAANAFHYANPIPVCTVNQAISPDPAIVTSGAATGFSASPALPEGLNLRADGAIIGTPTVAITLRTITVTATFASGKPAKALVDLTVLGALTYPDHDALVFPLGQAIPATLPSYAGGPAPSLDLLLPIAQGATAGLPPGLKFNPGNGALTGTPTALGTWGFTVLAFASGGPAYAPVTTSRTM